MIDLIILLFYMYHENINHYHFLNDIINCIFKYFLFLIILYAQIFVIYDHVLAINLTLILKILIDHLLISQMHQNEEIVQLNYYLYQYI